MHIKSTDIREKRWQELEKATCESTTSGALDVAAIHYLKMVGGTTAIPHGAIDELLYLAREEGSVTPKQIANVLNTEEYPVNVELRISTGHNALRE